MTSAHETLPETGAVRCELRLGRWQDVLADVHCGAVITDPPYGARTHAGQRHGRRDPAYPDGWVSSAGLEYGAWTPSDVSEFVGSWSPRCSGWFCAFTSHDLLPAYVAALEAAGRYVFAPLACVQPGMNVRLAGDGPSNWTTWLVVARPRTLRNWGTRPGAYIGSPGRGPDRAESIVRGAKPLWLMRSIVADYTAPTDLVCDPCCGGASTLLAAQMLGRSSIGAELDRDTYAKAQARLAHMPVEQRGQLPIFGGDL